MKKRNIFGVRSVPISATLVASLLLVGASYAGPPAPGVYCFSATVTDSTLNPQLVGLKFTMTHSLSPVKGSTYVLTGKTTDYPADTKGATLTAVWSGTCHMEGDELFVEYQSRADGSPNFRGTTVGHATWHCNAKGRDCTGSYWASDSGVTPVPPTNPTPPSAFYVGYSSGKFTQVDCPK
jgi:hypothetical protein